MLDKQLIVKNFEKSLSTYDNYAIVQKQSAKKLVELINRKKFKNILEIGCYSGYLTRLINEKISFSSYLALDIVDCEGFIKKINPKINFLKKDIDEFETNQKFDLIVANASLQWSNDFSSTIKKLKSYLNNNGIIAISVFSNQNLYEIREIFNVGLNYMPINEIEKLFSKNAKIFEEKMTLQFKNPVEVLRHLKYTGVNSIQPNKFSYLELKQKLSVLNERFENKITYYPIYIID